MAVAAHLARQPWGHCLPLLALIYGQVGNGSSSMITHSMVSSVALFQIGRGGVLARLSPPRQVFTSSLLKPSASAYRGQWCLMVPSIPACGRFSPPHTCTGIGHGLMHPIPWTWFSWTAARARTHCQGYGQHGGSRRLLAGSFPPVGQSCGPQVGEFSLAPSHIPPWEGARTVFIG